MNWIIFVLIFVSLLRKKSSMKRDTQASSKDKRNKLKQQFVIALTLSLLFGLGWGFGFAATTSIPSVPVSVTLQAIFIVLTSFQGLLIFIMHCVRSEEARNVWKGWIHAITCHQITFAVRKKAKFPSQMGTSGEYRKATHNPYGTLSTSMTGKMDTMTRAVKKDLESSDMFVNQSAFVSTTLEPIEEVEKRDLSLNKEEKVKYELLPHHESPAAESDVPTPSERNAQAVSPFTSTPASPEEDVELTVMLSPVLDTFEVVNPKELPENEETSTEAVDPKVVPGKEKPHFDVIWVNSDAASETCPTGPQTCSVSPPAKSDGVSPQLDSGATTGMMIDVNSIFAANSAANTSSTEETTLL